MDLRLPVYTCRGLWGFVFAAFECLLFEMPICDSRHGCVNGDTTMADKDWVTVKLPRQLAEQIDQAIKPKHRHLPTPEPNSSAKPSQPTSNPTTPIASASTRRAVSSPPLSGVKVILCINETRQKLQERKIRGIILRGSFYDRALGESISHLTRIDVLAAACGAR